MNREEKAVSLKHSGFNCAQAVLLAYADELSLDEQTLAKLGASFGIGMGTLDATCGALCAAQMILGLKKFEGRPVIPNAKELFSEFKSLCGSTHCGELKGKDTGVVLCPCDDCVRNAVKSLKKITDNK